MHKPSLALTMIVLGVLLTYFFFQPVKEITTYQELTQLPENTPVTTQGSVIKQTFSQKITYLTLANNITLILQESQSYLNQTIKVKGTVDTFRYPKIQVTDIQIMQKKE